MMPFAMIRADGAGRGLEARERREQQAFRRRHRQQTHGDFGDDAEHAFGAGEQREQVVAGAVERGAADRQLVAFERQHLQAQHVVNGESVLEAVHTAGILGDVAADAARDLRRRIGRVVEAVTGRRFGNGEVTHSGLDARDAIVGIDLDDARQLRQTEQHAIGRAGARRPRVRCPRRAAPAARDSRDIRASPREPARHSPAAPRSTAFVSPPSGRRFRTVFLREDR